MKKNLNATLVNDLVNTLLGALETSDETSWLDSMLENDLTLEELLGGKVRQVSDEELIKEENDAWKKKLETASKMMNKNIEKAVEQVKNKERKVLIDSPVKVEKCKCGCNKPVDKCDCDTKKETKLNVKNAFTADSLKTPVEEKEEATVRLINVNKTSEKALERIYNLIKLHANNGSVVVDFLDESWDDLLLNVRASTVEKVMSRVANYLEEKGFDVMIAVSYVDDSIEEMAMEIAW